MPACNPFLFPPFLLQASTSASANDWMFCPLSGYMLELDPVRGVAHCLMTGYQKSLQELSSIRIEAQANMAVRGAWQAPRKRLELVLNDVAPRGCGH